uniref:Uncharacterized protein n=1 Tax=Magallana gigas TaxID=29159 RepID=A0A8W8MQ87_MAGGI
MVSLHHPKEMIRAVHQHYVHGRCQELNAISPQTGMAHLWNVPDLGAPTTVDNEMEVESSVNPLHLNMEKMVFSKSNVLPPYDRSVIELYRETHKSTET